jgi:hypothetical protein
MADRVIEIYSEAAAGVATRGHTSATTQPHGQTS